MPVRKSRFAENAAIVIENMLSLLRQELELPMVFRNGDPEVGEGWCILSPTTLSEVDGKVGPFNVQFVAVASFATYAEGFAWATKTTFNLSALAPQIAANIDTKCMLYDVQIVGDIYAGTPKAPTKLPGSSVADTWVMTVSATLALQLTIQRDIMAGHV